MTEDHINEPRDLGYNKKYKELFKKWIDKSNTQSIFSGVTQADLFFFAMALGHLRGKPEKVSNKAPDIPINVLSERQKWGILSTGITDNKDLLVLKDEKRIYNTAEEYMEDGIQRLQAHIEKYGLNYPKYLEGELKDILKQ